MRTQDEILERILDRKGSDFLGFECEVLYTYLTYDNVLQFLKEDHVLERDDWTDGLGDSAVFKELKGYMEFALGKAYNHRGISAGRSISKMTSYLWLLGNDDLFDKFLNAGYAQYGVPQLMVVCEAFDMDVPDYMQDEIANMAQGDPCEPGCDEGCGL